MIRVTIRRAALALVDASRDAGAGLTGAGDRTSPDGRFRAVRGLSVEQPSVTDCIVAKYDQR